ncbi:Thyroglobulin type-1 domain-containing protein [Caenorhabditis elegans]|nr:Thyroglobulin type-1 domain-containing protein [Caenorhabditis elegans]CDK13389.1 Thyroglobulin type-1 domain-containing protein [Caenorhabditis elegans]|eukprot:NP_001293712.1 Uncharacterized protein CELE_F58F9.6 [Caenorhabditis elegans]
MQCGPLPEEDTDTSKPCCPKGGLWSSWSGYIRNYASNGWERTRSCLSGTAGCQCTGSTVETSNKCPCRAMIDVSDKVKRNLKTFPLSVDYDGNSCTARQNLEYFNNVPTQIVPCNAWKNYLYTAAIRYVTPNDKIVEQRVANCLALGQKQVSLFCDLNSGYWRLVSNNDEVVGFNLINLILSWGSYVL